MPTTRRPSFLPSTPPPTPNDLHAWLIAALGLDIPRKPLPPLTPRPGLPASPRADAPFDYIVHSFFEGAVDSPSPPVGPDSIVWAARGSGKTLLGAVATLLDLIFKPSIRIKILAGSLEQSQRMHEHLARFFERDGLRPLLARPVTARRVELLNHSRADVLAASQTSIRGVRVQKIRCDEVELFDPALWRAAQLTTRSLHCPGPWGNTVRGSIDALSTMHQPAGLMHQLISQAQSPAQPGQPPRRVFRWSILDTLAHCDDHAHHCNTCALAPECDGRVKARDRDALLIPSRGFVSIHDALRLKSRVDPATWESEMLCLRPRRSDAVYHEFDPRIHVFSPHPAPSSAPSSVPLTSALGGQCSPVVDEASIIQPLASPSTSSSSPSPSHTSLPLSSSSSLPSDSPITLLAAIDFGFRADTAILLASLDSSGVLRILRESVRPALRLEEHIETLRAWQRDLASRALPPIRWIAIDPAGHQVNHQTGLSNAAVLKKAGFALRSRHSHVMEGVALIHKRLAPNLAEPGALPDPSLLISSDCPRLIESLQKYRFDQRRPESLLPLKDGSDHPADALRYLIVNLDGLPAAPNIRAY